MNGRNEGLAFRRMFLVIVNAIPCSSSFLVLMFRIQSKLMSAIEPEESEKHGNPFAVERAAMAYTNREGMRPRWISHF